MIVLLCDRTGISARRVTLLDRLKARSRARRLDRQLANGAEPESSVLLSVRAQLLTRDAERRVLARSLGRAMRAALPSGRAWRMLPVRRDAVWGARAELEGLAARLMAAGPVNVQGVAQVRLLLADGAGPLYLGRTGRDLQSELRAAAAALTPQFER